MWWGPPVPANWGQPMLQRTGPSSDLCAWMFCVCVSLCACVLVCLRGCVRMCLHGHGVVILSFAMLVWGLLFPLRLETLAFAISVLESCCVPSLRGEAVVCQGPKKVCHLSLIACLHQDEDGEAYARQRATSPETEMATQDSHAPNDKDIQQFSRLGSQTKMVNTKFTIIVCGNGRLLS